MDEFFDILDIHLEFPSSIAMAMEIHRLRQELVRTTSQLVTESLSNEATESLSNEANQTNEATESLSDEAPSDQFLKELRTRFWNSLYLNFGGDLPLKILSCFDDVMPLSTKSLSDEANNTPSEITLSLKITGD